MLLPQASLLVPLLRSKVAHHQRALRQLLEEALWLLVVDEEVEGLGGARERQRREDEPHTVRVVFESAKQLPRQELEMG